MILVAGGTGHLGTELVPSLAEAGYKVRVLSRNPDRAGRRVAAGVEVVAGDARDQSSLSAATSGVDTVISAMTGFGPGGPGPRAVDYSGNVNLIRASEAAGVRRLVLLSMHGAKPDHPMELLREKFRAEEVLRSSRLEWTIVRPTVFMELWVDLIGGPILKSGATAVFGHGTNPMNFVSVKDLAAVVALLVGEAGCGQVVDVGGPEDVSLNDLVERFVIASGRQARVRHIPIPALRLGRLLLRPVRPDLAGLLEAGITSATTDMTFDDAAHFRSRFPGRVQTRLDEAIARYLGAAGLKETTNTKEKR